MAPKNEKTRKVEEMKKVEKAEKVVDTSKESSKASSTKPKSNKLSKQIKKGDLVMVRSGSGKGKTAKVVESIRKDNKVILEGIMEQTDYQKNKLANVSLGKRIKNAPVHISKIKLAN